MQAFKEQNIFASHTNCSFQVFAYRRMYNFLIIRNKLKLSLILIVKDMTALEESCSSMHPGEAQKKLPHHKR